MRTLDCGCVVNLGGYPIERCRACEVALEARIEADICEHGRRAVDCGRCGLEGQKKRNEDKRESERSWGY